MAKKIYLTSDLHFGHDREFIWKVRGYDSVEHMNTRQVEKWNAIVDDDDDVFDMDNIDDLKDNDFEEHFDFLDDEAEADFLELQNILEEE